MNGGEIRALSPTRAIRVLQYESVAHALIDSEDTRNSERGTLVHGIMFGETPRTVRIDSDSYRTKAARKARDAARAEGIIPLLRDEEDAFTVAVERLHPKLARYPYTNHHVKLNWNANGCPHRGELDQWDAADIWIGDLKTCKSGAAIKQAKPRAIIENGYHIQAAAYREAVSIVHGIDLQSIRVRLHFAEVEPPFGLVTRELTPLMLRLGARQWERARRLWLAAYRAPSIEPYMGVDDGEADAPEWALREEAEREINDRGEEPF